MSANATTATTFRVIGPRVRRHRSPVGRWYRRNERSALGIAGLVSFFAFWQIGSMAGWIDPFFFSSPSDVFTAAVAEVQLPRFWEDVRYSLTEVTVGLFASVVLAVPLGLAIGKYQRVRDFFMPVIEILRPIPAIAWVPMSIMLWPNNEASIVFITFIGAFFPILLNTIHGVHSLDGVLIRAGRCLGASESRLLLNVILPGSLPHIFTGLAVGMGVAWVSLIAAEMISGQFGVGYFTWEAYSLVNYPAIVLGMITIGVLGLACSGIIRMVGVLMMPWLAFAPGRKK